MAKQGRIGRTTTTTVSTRSRKGPTTTTTTTRNTVPSARRPSRKQATAASPRKKGHGKVIAAAIIIILALGGIAYFLMSSSTPAQQRSQFSSQLSAMHNTGQNLTLFYLANAPNYRLPLNQSWSIQVTDSNSTGSGPIGQFTISWSGQSKSLYIQDGIVNTGMSPTYAVTLSHSQFMQFSQAAIARDTATAVGYYTAYFISGSLKYTRVN
jgi:hypothetical protein